MTEFAKKTILVIGDLILDEFLYGTASRLSPEAPVPVMSVGASEYRLGGAANVAANIRDLGGTPILIGVTGNDIEGHALSGLIYNADIEARLVRTERRTAQKTRVICNGQQIARLDREDTSELSSGEKQHLINNSIRLVPHVGAVVISDYAKGVVSRDLLSEITTAAFPDVPVFLDPKVSTLYRGLGFTCITPNEQEALGLTGQSDVALAGAALTSWSKYTLVTCGKDGMKLFTENSYTHFPTTAQSVFDVSGAGDTVIATLATAFASGMSMPEAAHLANLAAGIVVSKAGTATVTVDELEKEEEEWQSRKQTASQ